MIKVKRLRHATFTTADIEAKLDYYQSIIGLGIIARDGGRILLGTESDELTLVLERGTASLLTSIAYEVAPGLEPGDPRRR